MNQEKQNLIAAIVDHMQNERKANALKHGLKPYETSHKEDVAEVEAILDWDANIQSLEDFCAVNEWESYFDFYKDVHGISPRWTSWTDHTADEWEVLVSNLTAQFA